MVKTIIKGNKCKQIECDKCGSLLEYTPNDEILTPTNYYRQDKYIVCPECGHHVYTVIN
jgi:DNA-directed RNA polymerase subunit RPC12/RpoP